MMAQKIIYPLFRKYANERNFFKIISSQEFEELSITGGKWHLHHFKANILPDRNFIHDLTFNDQKNILEINENEYMGKRAQSI
jgi:hypothetical protein